MEGYTVFVDWKNKYCLNDYTTQDNLQIQCNLYKNTSGIFIEVEKIILQPELEYKF